MEGVPAVIFTDTPIFSRGPVPFAGLFPRGRGCGVRVKFVILVEVPVLHHAEAGGGAQVLAAALVLLDGLVKGPELAEKGHVLLTQPHHLLAQQSQRCVQVGRFVRQQVVTVVPAAAQVVLDHGFLHVHPLHFSPGASAGVEQPAQAFGQWW